MIIMIIMTIMVLIIYIYIYIYIAKLPGCARRATDSVRVPLGLVVAGSALVIHIYINARFYPPQLPPV